MYFVSFLLKKLTKMSQHNSAGINNQIKMQMRKKKIAQKMFNLTLQNVNGRFFIGNCSLKIT